jgi:hypothetical protein
MKSRPILFNGDMVRAILAGKKSQTRRPMKQAPRLASCEDIAWQPHWCPYGVPGDELWVREAFGDAGPWAGLGSADPPEYVAYRADGACRYFGDVHVEGGKRVRATYWDFNAIDPVTKRPLMRWIPSIHMPRWASRITLKITNVRVQQLMDASEADIIAEGFTDPTGYQCALMRAYGDGITYVNPWVWAITFEVKP